MNNCRLAGLAVTQSSVSRDLRDLGAIKAGNGYELPTSGHDGERELAAVASLIRKIAPAGPHLLVIKTAIGASPSRWTAVAGPKSSATSAAMTRYSLRPHRQPARNSLRRKSTAPSLDKFFSLSKESLVSSDHSPIILAFSGGLDTSFCVPWLRETCGREVVTATIDTGGIDAQAAEDLEQRAMALGAIEHVRVDARADFFNGVIRHLVAGNVLRGNTYPLCVGAERGLQAERLAQLGGRQ